jgi:hypothetical protein
MNHIAILFHTFFVNFIARNPISIENKRITIHDEILTIYKNIIIDIGSHRQSVLASSSPDCVFRALNLTDNDVTPAFEIKDMDVFCKQHQDRCDLILIAPFACNISLCESTSIDPEVVENVTESDLICMKWQLKSIDPSAPFDDVALPDTMKIRCESIYEEISSRLLKPVSDYFSVSKNDLIKPLLQWTIMKFESEEDMKERMKKAYASSVHKNYRTAVKYILLRLKQNCDETVNICE